MEEIKKQSKLVFFVEHILNPEALFLSGKIMFFLILGALAIERWLEVCSSIPNITARAICYSATMLISIWLVQQGMELVLGEKE